MRERGGEGKENGGREGGGAGMNFEVIIHVHECHLHVV